mgnify:CR=1 FL=1
MKFARELVKSSQFQHFCDDFFADDDLNNYKMLHEIYRSRGEIHTNHNTEVKKKCSVNMIDAIKGIEEM